MKTLASPSFFRTFDLLFDAGNPGAKLTHWNYDGVEWVRYRYSVTGPSHGFTIDIISLTQPGRRGWSLMVAKEHWWAGGEAIKNAQWSRPVSGQRRDIIDWFRRQAAALERDRRALQGSRGSDR
ncbi:MAG: hypothetical protein P8Y53_18355 [Pseudolabrys sp.]